MLVKMFGLSLSSLARQGTVGHKTPINQVIQDTLKWRRENICSKRRLKAAHQKSHFHQKLVSTLGQSLQSSKQVSVQTSAFSETDRLIPRS